MLPVNIEFHPDAVAEAKAARMWYAQRSPAAAQAFVDELDRAIETIVANPNRWPVYVRTTRRYLFHRFPFLLVYRVTENHIQIVAVAHAHRRVGYWKERVIS